MKNNQVDSAISEKRRNPRIKIITDVFYLILDNDGKSISHGEGRILNLSQSGALIETLEILAGVSIVLMTIDLDGKEVEVKGRPIYSKMQEATGYYISGIDFLGPEDQQVIAIVTFIKSYYQGKTHGEFIELSDIPVIISK